MSTQLTAAVVRLREMILRGGLKPGQRVAEIPLAEQLGMSRTPVRQALPLLAQEGLLSQLDTRGYVVRAFTAEDIVTAIDVRSVLEGLAARRVAEAGASRALIRELRSCLEDGNTILVKGNVVESDEAAYAEMNARFHSLILDEADSPIIAEALERNARIPFAGPQALAFDKGNLAQMFSLLNYAHRQHHSIVQALEHGHGARAEALMREHAVTVKDSINTAGMQVNVSGTGERFALVR